MHASARSGSRGWAVVTGASAGLGVEFARQLAQRGHDVVLVARRRERMDALAAELVAAHGVRTHVIARDLGAPGASAALVGELEAAGIAPAVLVNNAGFGPHGGALEVPVERTIAMIDLNVTALTDLTLRVAAGMVARGSGAILNVASTAAFQPAPYFAAYSATKAYVASFSQALARELAPRGVRVTTLCPGPTKTEFFEAAEMKLTVSDALMMDAPRCVAIGLAAMERGRPLVVAGVLNAVGAWLARVLPLWLVVPISGWVMRPRGRPALSSPKR